MYTREHTENYLIRTNLSSEITIWNVSVHQLPPKGLQKENTQGLLVRCAVEINLSSALILKYRTMIQSIRNVLIIINIMMMS